MTVSKRNDEQTVYYFGIYLLFFYSVSGYNDVIAVLTNHALFSTQCEVSGQNAQWTLWLLGPEHPV